MEAFNAEPAVRKLRESAYAERYVVVKPSAPLLGLRLESGGELHHDDGTIVRLDPGDWAVELPDGSLGRITAASFVESFTVSGDDEQFRKARVQVGLEEPKEGDFPEPPAEPVDIPATAKESYEAAVAETRALVKTWADAAFEGELLTDEERHNMIENSELPEGLVVEQAGARWKITRDKQSVGTLDSDDGEDLSDLTNDELRERLEAAGAEFSVKDRKADLIEKVQDLEDAQAETDEEEEATTE